MTKKHKQSRKEQQRQYYLDHKPEIVAYRHQYYLDHHDEKLQYQREEYKRNKANYKKRSQIYYINNREAIYQRCRKYDSDNKHKAFIIIGGGYLRCMCDGLLWSCWHNGQCLVDDFDILHNDHINGGGNKDRKLRDIKTISRWTIKHPKEAKKIYRLLCANCNWKKAVITKEFCGAPIYKSRS